MRKILTLFFVLALVCVKGRGQTATANWPLTSNANATVSGNITAGAFTRGPNGTIQSFDANLGAGVSSLPTSDFNGGTNDPSIYYQFTVTPTPGNRAAVSNFTFAASAANNANNTIQVDVEYYISSTGTGNDQTFYQKATSAVISSLTGNSTNKTVTANLNISVPAGSTLYIRVYPSGRNSSTTTFYAKNATVNATTTTVPLNDDCSNATTMTPGSVCNSVSGSLVNSTVSSQFAAADVWYTFTVPTRAPYTIRAVPTNNFDIGIKLYKACGTTNSVVDVDNNGSNEAEAISIILDPGTYYYRIYNSNSSPNGNFTTCVIGGTPANDDCTNAITLLSNTPTAGTTANATLAAAGGKGFSDPNDKTSDVWYKFVPCSNSVTISTSTSNQDLDLFVFQANSCPSITSKTANRNGFTDFNLSSETTGSFAVTPGATYYIRVALDQYQPGGFLGLDDVSFGSIPGDFTITVTSAVTQPTATLTTNNATQTVCNNSPIAAIKYNLGNNTSATVSGLPTGVTSSIVSNVLTISGTPNTTTVSNPYTVTLTNSCAAATVNGTITVNPNAIISLTSQTNTNTQTVCSGVAITPIKYTIGGGGTGGTLTSTPALPAGISGSFSGGVFTISGSASVATATTYNYTVTTTGTCTQTSATGTIKINPLPSATISASGSPVCQNGTQPVVTFTGSLGTAPYTFTYNINGGTATTVTSTGNTATLPVPTTVSGSFTYNLTSVKDDNATACSSTITGKSVTVTVNPLADATITSVTPICSGQQSTLTIFSQSGGTIKYSFGSIQKTVTLPPNGSKSDNTGNLTSDATYSIISVTGTTCPNNAPNSTTTVKVNPLPTATITGDSYVQLGNTDKLTGSGGGTWNSSNPAAATVNGSGLVTAVSTGTTTITYTVTNATTTCSNSDTKVVNVTADYITRANGNFSNIATWTKYTQNGPANATVIPASINTIEVAHALTLDQDFEVGTGKSFNIITNGSFIIQPGKMFKALGTVNFGSHLVTVQSNDSTAGAIGRMANTIGGANNVRVERFIPLTPTNGSLGRTGRAWRLITSPITNQTIKQAWQEGKTWQGGTTETTTGLGTIITGEGDLNHMSSSFDFIPASAHHTSIKQYAPAPGGGAWVQLPGNATTGTNIPVSSQPAWMLFVRGDRTANTPTAKSATTLRATGTLNQSPVTVTVSGSNAYTLVGNPYASAINFDQILSTSQGIQPGFLVWNSKLGTYGAYVRVAKGNGGNYRTVPFPLTGNDNPTLDENAKYIQSSEGFFVAPATPGTDGSLTISEASKPSSDTVGINPYREGSDNDKKIWVNLNLKESDTASTLADGVLVKFASDYAPGVDGYDALKLSNFNENLSVLAQSQNLMVEARPDVAKTDTVELKVWNLVKRPYQLQMKSEHFDSSLSVHAWLEDNYLKTKQDLNLQGEVTTVDFDVTSEAASYAADRFRIVFENKTLGALPVTLTSIKATPKNSGVEVSWTVTNEQNMQQYVVERSTDGGRTYTAVAEQAAANASVSNNYIGFDAAPLRGDNIYRIKMEGKEGSISYSATVKVTISEQGGIQISLYPNPVSRTRQGGKASLQLKGLSAGVYSLNVYSHGGQRVYQKKITVLAASASQTEDIRLNGGLAQGSYEVRFTNSKGKVLYSQQLIVTE